jgi:transposase
METSVSWSPAPTLNVVSVQRGEQTWTVTVDSRRPTSCPGCGTQSKSRHSAYSRTLRDLSAQGAPVIINVRVARWRCRNQRCDRRIFTERLPGLAEPFARRTARLAGIVRLLGHSAGGRPSERLMRRLGMPVSDTTILRSLKEHDRARSDNGAVHVAGIDDWAWRKGANYGTIIVDLERRRVVDLLADRSAASTASWFMDHPEVEVVSRDRAGLYAEAARQGAPQARQALPARSDCASDAVTQKRLMRRGRQAVRQELFDEIRALFEGGSSIREIARKLGLGRRRVERWVRRIDLPDLNTMASKPCTPTHFGTLLARRWAEGITKVRHLFAEIRHRGYTGSYSHLARFLAPWRNCEPLFDGDEQVRVEQEEPAPVRVRTLDPMTGRVISPLTAAALCVKPRGQMTARQVANVDALKAASAEFTAMRHLAMRFRGLLRGGTPERLDAWLIDARASGIYAMQRFARTIRQDLEAVRNAVLEPWSNGQTEGQINKLKTLKRAMYGRAGVNLLRARMLPLQEGSLHQE